MSVTLNPYISFRGNAGEALAFYQSVFGGTVDTTTYGEMPGMEVDPSETELVSHGHLVADNGIVLMASDMKDAEPFNGSISLSGDDKETLSGYFEKLADGGQIVEPLVEAPWGDTFGMLVDKFGVNWMVNIAGLAG